MSAFAKIPLQMLILVTGVLVFVFYLFTEPPMLFNTVHEDRVHASARGTEYEALSTEFEAAFDSRRRAAGELVAAREAGDEVRTAASTEVFIERDARLRDVRTRAENTGQGGHRR